MINFIIGRSGYGKSTAVLEGIKKDISCGKRIYLIVPEQQAVVWETRAAKELGPRAFLSLDIVGFSRLANLVCRRFGNLSYNYIGRGEKALAVWAAVLSVKAWLKKYAVADGQEDRSVALMSDAISELKRHGVTPAMLEKAVSELDLSDAASASLADRMSDLALVSSAYEAIIKDRFDDADDELSKLNKTLSVRDFFSGTSVYIDSYYSLTPDQHGIVESIFRQADDVTVTFACDFDTDEPQFSHTERMYKSLVSTVASIGKEYKKTVLTDDKRHTDSMLSYLEKHLFEPSAVQYDGDYTDSVRILHPNDRYDEAQAVSAEICRIVHNGARYRDIAVIAYDIDSYRGIIDRALEREGIPFHLLDRSRLASEPSARLIFASLSLVARGWQTDDVISLAKTGLFGLTPDETDALERYVKAWRIRGIHGYDHPWSMNPDGYTEEMTDRAVNVLELANSAREKLFTPLETFADATSGDVLSLTSLCKTCYDLTVELDVYDKLEAEADEYAQNGQSDEAVRIRQVYPAIVKALDTVAITLPDAKADIARFSRLLRKVIDETDIGTIPASSDEVILGSAAMVRTDNVKHVFLLGVTDGEFPGVPADTGFFSDSDKIILEGSGIILSDKTELAVNAELFSFYRAAVAASESLTVSVPLAGDDGALIPSEGAKAIAQMFPKIRHIFTSAYTPDDLIWSKASLSAKASVLEKRYPGFSADASSFTELLTDGEGLMTADGAKLTSDIAAALFGNRFELSKSKIDKFVGCPFSYLCRYVLNLEEENQAKIRSVDVGNIVHRILELYYKETKNRPLPLPENERNELAERLICEYADAVLGGRKNPRITYLFRRLKRSVLLFIKAIDAEFAQSEFRPYKFELPIKNGADGAVAPLVFDLGEAVKVSVGGKIDRVDIYRENGKAYVRVVDYKTGDTAFSLDRIRRGLDMQLLIYLFTLWKCPESEFRRELGEADEIVPAGALYFNISVKESGCDSPSDARDAESTAIDSLKRSGIVCDDEDILRKMDREMTGKYIPAKLNKDGSFSAYSSVASLDEFGKLYTEIEDNVKRIATEMRNGRCEAKPMKEHRKNACEHCADKAVCRNSDDGKDGEDDG